MNNEKNNVPIYHKLLLTINETIMYSNIGRDKLLNITSDPNCSFVVWNGTHRLINRQKFEKFINNITVL